VKAKVELVVLTQVLVKAKEELVVSMKVLVKPMVEVIGSMGEEGLLMGEGGLVKY
jgi:hypothetical protein